jgi:CRP-like cAMP-binding protein
MLTTIEPHLRDQKMETAWNSSFLGQVKDPSLREALLSDAVHSTFNPGNLVRTDNFPWVAETWPITLVVDGVFREFLGSESGRQATVQYMRPGDVWGLVRALHEGPAFDQHASYQALAPSRLISFNRAKFLGAIQTRPALAVSLARELSRLLVLRTRNFESSVFADTSTRVAQHIAQLATEDENGIPAVWLSQQELADAVGTVREVVTRIIGQFRARGILRYSGRRLEILDMEKLLSASLLLEPEQAPRARREHSALRVGSQAAAEHRLGNARLGAIGWRGAVVGAEHHPFVACVLAQETDRRRGHQGCVVVQGTHYVRWQPAGSACAASVSVKADGLVGQETAAVGHDEGKSGEAVEDAGDDKFGRDQGSVDVPPEQPVERRVGVQELVRGRNRAGVQEQRHVQLDRGRPEAVVSRLPQRARKTARRDHRAPHAQHGHGPPQLPGG